jgi:hypothetical protein
VLGIAFKCPNAGGTADADAAPPAPAAPAYLTQCPQREGESARQRAIRCKAEVGTSPQQ